MINEQTPVDGPNLGRHVVIAFIGHRLRQILLCYVLITTVTNCWRCQFIGIRVDLDVFSHCADSAQTSQFIESKQFGKINHLILSNEVVVTGDGRWLIG